MFDRWISKATFRPSYTSHKDMKGSSEQINITLVGISCGIGGVDEHHPGALHRPGNVFCGGAGAPVRMFQQLRAHTQNLKRLMTNLDEGKV